MFKHPDFFRQILEKCIPHFCPFCDERSYDHFCSKCSEALTPNRCRCITCALPLSEPGTNLCGECLSRSSSIERSVVPLIYDSKMANCIAEFKAKGKLRAGKQLTRYLLEDIQANQAERGVDHIVAVPTHWRTQLRRSFNPASEIAQFTSKKLGIPIANALTKADATLTQKTLNRNARLKNLRHAFKARHPLQELGHVALIDDVVTTGATVNSCAILLKKIGARRVDVWALARTPTQT